MTGRPNRKWPKRLLWGTGALLVLSVAVLLGARAMLPWMVTRFAERAAREYLGVPLKIGNVDFALRRGEILLENLRVSRPAERVPEKATNDKTPLLEIPRIALHWSWSDLRQKRLTVTALTIDAPVLQIAREADGSLDPLRHRVSVSRTPLKPAAAIHAPTRSWPVEVRSFSVRMPKVVVTEISTEKKLLEFSLESFELDQLSREDGSLGLGSLAVRGPQLWVRKELVLNESAGRSVATKDEKPAPRPGPSLRIKAVDVQRAKFTWEGKEGPLDVFLTLKVSGVTDEAKMQFPLEMSVRVGGGELNLAGDAGVFPPFFQGQVSWHDLAFPPLLLAVRPDLMDWLQSANSSGKIDLVLDSAGLKGLPVIHVSGQTSLENLSAAAPGNNRVSLGCRRLDLEITRLIYPLYAKGAPPRPIVADIASIRADTPWLVYAHPASFWGLLGDGDEPFLAEASLGRLEVKGGDIKLQDTTVSATSVVSNLTVTADDARYPELSCGSLRVNATLATSSQFSLEGRVNPGWKGDFRVGLQDLELPAWNPYAKDFGISLDAGTVSLHTKLAFAGSSVEAENEVIFRWLDVSFPNTAAPAIGMPVDLAIALLRDPTGEIKLNVPLRMDEGGATVGKDGVVASALRAAVLGALSSPLKILNVGGKKTPGAGAQLAIPPFSCAAGTAEPGREAPARAQKIVSLLADRPEIYFTIAGRTNPADRTVLAEQILLDQTGAGGKLPRVKDAGFLALRRIGIFLGKRAKGEAAELEPADRPLFDRLVAAVEVPRDQLDALANKRAEMLKALLVKKGAAASRLWIEKPAPDGDPGAVMAFHLSGPKKKTEIKPRRTAQTGT